MKLPLKKGKTENVYIFEESSISNNAAIIKMKVRQTIE
jgi:hypothetical protein